MLPAQAYDGKRPQFLRASFQVQDPAALTTLVLDDNNVSSMRVYLNGTLNPRPRALRGMRVKFKAKFVKSKARRTPLR